MCSLAHAPSVPTPTAAIDGSLRTPAEAYALARVSGRELTELLLAAARINDCARPEKRVTYSRKLFLPLTNLCRDRCGYCTFVKGPAQRDAHTMTPDEVLAVARRGAALGQSKLRTQADAHVAVGEQLCQLVVAALFESVCE